VEILTDSIYPEPMTMGHFGEDLRKERESRGISLSSIVDATKITSRHLAALEGNQFNELPGGVFNKGIVRSYARMVGLDEEAWVGRFMTEYEQSGQLKNDDADWINFAENVGKSRKTEARPKMRLRWAGVGMLVLLLGGLGWFVWHYVREKLSAQIPSRPAVVLFHSANRVESASLAESTPTIVRSGSQTRIGSRIVPRPA
jgi:cytoskeleton protein RodZ